MLTDAKKKELLVLYTIVQSTECSLQKLSQELSIPKRTIKEIIRKINGTILQQLEIQRFIYSNTKGEIKLNTSCKDEKMAIFHYVKLLFLRESNRFNFLMLLFNSPNVYVPKKFLLEQLYISPSYLEKLTNQLNQSLEKFHIKIISRQNCYILKGNELSLRIYMYHFFSNAFQGIDWPLTHLKFSQVKKAQLSNELLIPKKSMKSQEKIYLLVAIFLMRSSHQPLEDAQTNDIYEIMRTLKQTKDFTGELNQQLSRFLPKKFVQNELLYFNFLLCYFFPNSIPEQQKTLFGYEFSKSNFPLCRQVSLLVKKLTESFPKIETVEKKYYYHYLIMMLAAFILLFEEKVDHFYTLYFPNNNLKKKEPDSQVEEIQALIASIFSDHPMKKLLCQHLSQLIDTLLLSEEKKVLAVHLQIQQTISGNYHIENRLKRIFNDQFLQITENPEHADLVITDGFDSQQHAAEIFYFDLNRENDLWINFLHFIQKLHQN